MVSSASVALNRYYASKAHRFLVISVLAFFCYLYSAVGVWNKLYLVGWLGALAFAVVVLLPGVGHTVNGATRWLQISGFTFASLGGRKVRINDLYLAGYLHRYGEQLSGRTRQDICTLGMIVS